MAFKLLLAMVLLVFGVSALSVNAAHHYKHRFVLVHGSGHGAWCWYKVTALLQNEGHKVDALDLTSAGISDVKASSVETLVHYTSPLIDLLQALPPKEKVVLVGHSYGGLSLTYVAEHFPHKIAAAIYLTAFMLASGPPGPVLFSKIFEAVTAPGGPAFITDGGTASFHLDRVQDFLYNTSPFKDVVLAQALLKPCPLFDVTVNFTRKNYGSVTRYFIKTLQDKVLTPQDQDLMISTTPPTGVFNIDTDHSAFFSDPSGLVQLLLFITASTESTSKYSIA